MYAWISKEIIVVSVTDDIFQRCHLCFMELVHLQNQPNYPFANILKNLTFAALKDSVFEYVVGIELFSILWEYNKNILNPSQITGNLQGKPCLQGIRLAKNKKYKSAMPMKLNRNSKAKYKNK